LLLIARVLKSELGRMIHSLLGKIRQQVEAYSVEPMERPEIRRNSNRKRADYE
jgi:hypothetical protein